VKLIRSRHPSFQIRKVMVTIDWHCGRDRHLPSPTLSAGWMRSPTRHGGNKESDQQMAMLDPKWLRMRVSVFVFV
jgi:hypothetical protein